MKSRADLVCGEQAGGIWAAASGKGRVMAIKLRILGLALAGLCAAGPAFAAERVYRLDIEQQPLSAALRAFAEQSGLQVVYDARVAVGLQARGVAGSYTAAQALERLLEGRRARQRHRITRRGHRHPQTACRVMPPTAPPAPPPESPGPTRNAKRRLQ